MPPPPTGAISTSGALPNCSMISLATVPCPAIVRSSSKAGTSVAPDCWAWRLAAAEASS